METIAPTYRNEELVQNIQQYNCSQSMSSLIKENQGLWWKTARPYIEVAQKSGVCQQDIFDGMNYVFSWAAQTYDPHKGMFSTWLSDRVRYFCLDTINKTWNLNKHNTVPISDLSYKDSNHLVYEHQREEKDITEIALNQLDSLKDNRIKTIIQKRYLDDPRSTLEQLAELFKISLQRISQLEQEGLNFLRRRLKQEFA